LNPWVKQGNTGYLAKPDVRRLRTITLAAETTKSTLLSGLSVFRDTSM
jgi:hypothetical protein